MKAIYLVVTLSTFLLMSCKDGMIGAGGRDDRYFIYITGDSGRLVNISYLKRSEGSSNKNITVTESVALPFFKQVNTIDVRRWRDSSGPDNFLQIESTNDSTTRAIIFDDELQLVDSICRVFFIWETENAQNECAYCDGYPKDSVLTYLKSIKYPCYLEFSKGETLKKVRLHDWW